MSSSMKEKEYVDHTNNSATYICRDEVKDLIGKTIESLNEKFGINPDNEFPEPVVILCIDDGGRYLTGKIMEGIKFPYVEERVSITSYEGSKQKELSLGSCENMSDDYGNSHVIIVDDICDTGKTLSKVSDIVIERGGFPYTVTLLSKSTSEFTPDCSHHIIKSEDRNLWIYGAGMDLYCGGYRELDEIRSIKSIT